MAEGPSGIEGLKRRERGNERKANGERDDATLQTFPAT